ncbi:MAG: hypothetical protein NZ576_08085 [Bacteroidia bacterium]|nr:hypothetical protein [Bacteroidia bacterium]
MFFGLGHSFSNFNSEALLIQINSERVHALHEKTKNLRVLIYPIFRKRRGIYLSDTFKVTILKDRFYDFSVTSIYLLTTRFVTAEN